MAKQKPVKEKGKPKAIAKPAKAASKSFSLTSGKRLYQVIIFFFAIAIYVNSTFNDYNLDDELVTKNQHLTSKGWEVLKFNFDVFGSAVYADSSFSCKVKYFLPDVFREPYYQDQAYKYEYRPIGLATFALEHALLAKKEVVQGKEIEKDTPGPSHLINVILYALLCVFFFGLVVKLLPSYNIILPFIIALLFTAHPIHTEVVASIKNRDEILSLLFALIGLWYAVRYAESRKVVFLFLMVFFYMCGILSKPTAITFALLIPLTLVLLMQINYRDLMMVSIAVVVPSIFYSRQYLIRQQIMLGLSLLVFITILYVLKNASFKREHLMRYADEFRASFRNLFASKEMEPERIDFSALKTPLLAGVSTVIIVGCLFTAYWGINTGTTLLSCLPIFVLSIMYLLAPWSLRLVLSFFLTIIFSFLVAKTYGSTNLIELGFGVFLSGQIFSSNKILKITGLLNFVIFYACAIIFKSSFFFLYVLMFSAFFESTSFPDVTKLDWNSLKKPLTGFAALAILTVCVIAVVYGVYTGHMAVSLISLLFLSVLYILSPPEIRLICTPAITASGLLIAKTNPKAFMLDLGLGAFLASQVFGKNKTIRAVGVVNYIVYAAYEILISKSPLFIIILFFTAFFDAAQNGLSGARELKITQNALRSGAIIGGMLVCAGLSAWGIYAVQPLIAFIPLAVFGAIYLYTDNSIRVYALLPLSLLTILAISKFGIKGPILEIALVGFLASQIFSENKKLQVAGGISYLAYSAVTIWLLHSYAPAALLFFAGFFNRRFMVVSIIAMVSGMLAFVYVVSSEIHKEVLLASAYAIWTVIYLCALTLWRQQKQGLRLAGIFAISFFAFIYFQYIPHREIGGAGPGTLNYAYKEFKQVRAVDPTPVNSSRRPLTYLEYPINRTDPFTIKAGTAMTVLGTYLKLIFIPYPMSYYYGYAYFSPVKITGALPMAILLIYLAIGLTGLYFIRKKPLLSYAIFFYLIGIAAYSNLAIPIPGMLGDRFLLVPSIGFCFFLAFILGEIFKEDFRKKELTISSLKMPLKAALGIILCLYSVITFSRNANWKDHVTLFSHDINTVENSAQAQNLLALHTFFASNNERDPAKQLALRQDAVLHFKRSLEIYDSFVNVSFDLARTYDAMKRYDDAYASYENATKIDTNFKVPYYYMGVIKQGKGDYAASIPLFQKFLTKHKHAVEGYTKLSIAYFQLKQYDQALAESKKGIEVEPNSFISYLNAGKIFMLLNQKDSASFYLGKARALNPNDNTVNQLLNNLERPR
jgi:tetratricopeptide (TPR) repeat protein